ncbi:MAG: hypothetical protein IBJ11_05990 [Phycisphaerales bacterium]|nr:hypothetical protein [Phycisphaerales bacterium]
MDRNDRHERPEFSDARRKRVHELLDLVRASRGWSRAKLAQALDRDPTKVYPDSGNPKADFIVRLAELLEWPVGDVVETIWDAGDDAAAGPKPAASYEELYQRARAAHLAGQYQKVVDVARQMYAAAASEERKAFACAFEASGWDGLGRYTSEVDACRRGLAHSPVSVTTRNILRADLANAWYSLYDLTPALGTAQLLAEHYEAHPPAADKPVEHKRPAFVYYVRGNVFRKLMVEEPENKAQHAEAAARDLARSAEMYSDLAAKLGDPSLSGIANTCRGGLLECEVELGLREPGRTVAEISRAVEAVRGDERAIVGDQLESWGWWCIFGSNIALRHMTGRELQSSMRVFLDRAVRIADRLSNWAMRERVYTLQFSLHRMLADNTGLDLEMTIEPAERSLIAATMGRFPQFRPVGWKILETAKVVGAAGGVS